jgi:hypothetical protein
MTRKLRKNREDLFVILFYGEYWIYKPHPVYEWIGHRPITNLGSTRREAWDWISSLLHRCHDCGHHGTPSQGRIRDLGIYLCLSCFCQRLGIASVPSYEHSEDDGDAEP